MPVRPFWDGVAGPSAVVWSFCSSWKIPQQFRGGVLGLLGVGWGAGAASVPSWGAWDQHPPLARRSLPLWCCGLPALGLGACFYAALSLVSRPGRGHVKADPQHPPLKAGPSVSCSPG